MQGSTIEEYDEGERVATAHRLRLEAPMKRLGADDWEDWFDHWSARLGTDERLHYLSARTALLVALDVPPMRAVARLSQAELAKRLKANIRSVRRSLRQLESCGYLRLVRSGCGRGRIALYRLRLPEKPHG